MGDLLKLCFRRRLVGYFDITIEVSCWSLRICCGFADSHSGYESINGGKDY